MNTELFECKRLTIGILYQPRTIPHSLLNQMYADITKKYPYGNLQHLPDGVRMANANTNDFFIQNGRMQVNENVEYFHAAKSKAMDLFSIAQKSLRINQFAASGVKIIAALPTEKNEAGNILMDNAFGNLKDKTSLLGDGFRGMGMRIMLHTQNVRQIKFVKQSRFCH